MEGQAKVRAKAQVKVKSDGLRSHYLVIAITTLLIFLGCGADQPNTSVEEEIRKIDSAVVNSPPKPDSIKAVSTALRIAIEQEELPAYQTVAHNDSIILLSKQLETPMNLKIGKYSLTNISENQLDSCYARNGPIKYLKVRFNATKVNGYSVSVLTKCYKKRPDKVCVNYGSGVLIYIMLEEGKWETEVVSRDMS